MWLFGLRHNNIDFLSEAIRKLKMRKVVKDALKVKKEILHFE